MNTKFKVKKGDEVIVLAGKDDDDDDEDDDDDDDDDATQPPIESNAANYDSCESTQSPDAKWRKLMRGVSYCTLCMRPASECDPTRH